MRLLLFSEALGFSLLGLSVNPALAIAANPALSTDSKEKQHFLPAVFLEFRC